MFGTTFQKKTSEFISKAHLITLKLRALRAGVWSKALSKIDRVLVDLTIRVVGSVRSSTLAKNLIVMMGNWKGFWRPVTQDS